MKLNALPVLAWIVVLEAVALRWIYSFTWTKSALTSLYANALSLVVGMLLYPGLGTILYPVMAPFVLGAIGGGWSIEVIVTLLGVSIVDTLIELPFIAWIRKVRITLRSLTIFFAANVVGLAIMAAALVDYDELFEAAIPEEEIARLEGHYAPEIAFMQKIFAEVEKDYAEYDELHGREWERRKMQWKAEATEYRFLRLTVGKSFSHSIVFPQGMHGSHALRGEGSYRRDNVEVWRTMSRDGAWYYVYMIRESWQPQSLTVRAWFDRP